MELKRTIGLVSSGLLGMGFVAMALITLIPATASKLNRLGYYSVCSYAPVSTVILFILSTVFLLLGYSVFYRARKRPFTSS